MNIDLINAEEKFIKYAEKYNLNEERLLRKEHHSLRVMEISKVIAQKLKLSEEEIKIATLIGLLHDIARFEQYTRYQTFKDINSIDHGDLGAEILKTDLRNYIELSDYDDIIIKAVKNHNKFKIEEGLNEKEELFAKIIRDADKLDIMYQSTVKFWKGMEEEVENSILSKEVIKQFKDYSQVKNTPTESAIDNIMRVIGFIFDINFKQSFEILKENDYINKILERYDFKDEYTKQKIEEIKKIANEYIENNAMKKD